MLEFKILAHIKDSMESSGDTASTYHFDVSQQLADAINLKHSQNFTLTDLEKAVDKCIANRWVDHRELSEKYRHLGLTPSGLAEACSRERLEQIEESRTWIKKLSDRLEGHKGLILFLGFVVAFLGFLVDFFRKL